MITLSTDSTNIPTPSHDLASAVNAVTEFKGNDDDDVFTWERQVETAFKIFQLDEAAKLKLLLSKLRGKASEC